MKPVLARLLSFVLPILAASSSFADPTPIADPVLDPPTLRSLGVYWVIHDGDDAKVHIHYRKAGADAWNEGPPLLLLDKGPFKGEDGKPRPAIVDVPNDARLFAGSVLLLDPDTAYELRLKLTAPSGKSLERTLSAHTIAEPQAPTDAIQFHVVPGKGGGDGSANNPFKGLAAAQKSAKPATLFLLHAGVYEGPFYVDRNGERGKPIIWRGAGDGESIIDGMSPREKLAGAAIDAMGTHDVWFEKLSIRNANYAVRLHESSRIVVRRCHISGCICGVVADVNKTGNTSAFFISDNLFEGFMPWPTTTKEWHDLPESRAVWIAGTGHVACYNRIHHFKDGLDVDDSVATVACDFHNNEVSDCFDDGSEMDGSDRNTRNFLNRYTNVLTGVSLQPVHGGPVYVFRNVLYNVQTEVFKLHNSPSGGILVHNTSVKNGIASLVNTSDPLSNIYSRNNLLLGTEGRACNYECPAVRCDYDYDGFGGFSGDIFLKWNNERYRSPEDAKARAPIYKHAIVVDPATAFATGIKPPSDPKHVYDPATVDLRLNPGSTAIDAGEPLPGFNDHFKGSAPDLGAYELGEELPHYGPRPEK